MSTKIIKITDKIAIQNLSKKICKRQTIDSFEKHNNEHINSDISYIEYSHTDNTEGNEKNENNIDNKIPNTKIVKVFDFNKHSSNTIQEERNDLHIIDKIFNICSKYLQQLDENEKSTKDLINYIKNNNELSTHIKLCIFIIQEIERKSRSYKSQDIQKKQKRQDETVYNSTKQINTFDIIDKLYNTRLKCYYCDEYTKLYYTNIRNNKQWTLERLDNKKGHWNDNCVISCLSCNIRRGIMDEQRFMMTQKLKIIKQD